MSSLNIEREPAIEGGGGWRRMVEGWSLFVLWLREKSPPGCPTEIRTVVLPCGRPASLPLSYVTPHVSTPQATYLCHTPPTYLIYAMPQPSYGVPTRDTNSVPTLTRAGPLTTESHLTFLYHTPLIYATSHLATLQPRLSNNTFPLCYPTP
jgi:hypothetical protein